MSLNKKIISLLAGATIAASAFLSGCGEKTFKTEFKDIMKRDYKVTEEQADAAYVVAERGRYMTQNDDGTYSPSYKTVNLDQQIDRVQSMKNSLDEILATYPPHMWSKYIDEQQGMRELFIKREKVIDFHLRQLKAKKCYMEFQQMMGYAASGSKVVVETDKYNFSDLFPDKGFAEKFRLGRKDVDDAKVKQEIERFEMFQKFLRDVPNPEFPFKDKIKQTIKKEFKEGFVVIGYDITQPADNVVDYFEMYRKTKDGKLETSPAIRVYKSLRSDMPNIAVIDEDRQGERGYGLPDRVEKIIGLSRCADLVYYNGKMINSVFHNPYDIKKMRLIEADRDIEIVATGTIDQKLWVPSKEGYNVPIIYKNDADNNYTLSANKGVNLKDKKFEDWIFTRAYRDNDVTEMYRLKDAYRNLKIADVTVTSKTIAAEDGNTNRDLEITLELEDGDVKVGNQELFLEKIPMAIRYNNGSKYTDTLLDADGKDNPRYELRLRQAQPLTPIFSPLKK